MKRLLPLLVGALLLPCTAQASVSTWGNAAPQAHRHIERAEAFWAHRGAYATCPWGIEVTWWDFGGGVAWGEQGGCRIWIKPDYWRTATRGQRCQMMLHEYGHLAGMSHEWDHPRHIMYPRYDLLHPVCARIDQATLDFGPV